MRLAISLLALMLAACAGMPPIPPGTDQKCAQECASKFSQCMDSGWQEFFPVIHSHSCASGADACLAACPKNKP
jgi:hypothetical protein